MTFKIEIRRRLAVTLLALLLPGLAQAFACTSKKNGNWNNAGTWNSCNSSIPGTTDTAQINSGDTVTVDVAVTVGAVTVLGGGTLSTGSFNWTVNGTTSVTGTLSHTGTATTTLFIGAVTINSGGVWNNGGKSVTYRGGLTNNGTYNGGAGTQTFNTASQALGGSSAINFGASAVTVTGVTLTNNNTSVVSLTGTLGGTGTFVNGASATLNYGGTTTPMATPGTLTASASGNTVQYSAAAAQTIRAPSGNYYNLSLSGSGIKSAAAALTVNGDLTIAGTAAFSAGTLTHTFAGDWIVNSTNASPLTNASNGTIIFNAPTPATSTGIGGTGTAALAFNILTIQNANVFTLNKSISATGIVTVGAGTTLSPAAANIVSGTGTLTGSGTVLVTRTAATADFSSQYTIANKTLGGLTVQYAGAAAQTVSNVGYTNLAINNASGVTLAANTTVAGTLTLSSGKLTTGANTLTMGGSSTVAGGSATSYVVGNLQKTYTSAANFTFPIGDATSYAPVLIAPTTGFASGSLTLSTTASDAPLLSQSQIDPAVSVNRYWTLTSASVAGTYDATVTYLASSIDSGATATDFVNQFYSGASWAYNGAAACTTTQCVISGATGFGVLALGSTITTCFADAFPSLGTPGTDWVVGSEGTRLFTPAVVSGTGGNRLRLTDAQSTESTFATLQRLFPAAGNKVVVEFEHFAYGGTGADGMGIVLSDAGQPPIAGAFGGSLGYAQKRADQGGDTTHPGFVGGWLGVALDELGNFSAPTEGRNGGPGVRAQSVAVRGSGAGYTGYAYLGGSTMTTPIDNNNTASPTHKYKITVDNTFVTNAWTKVERNTTGTYVEVVPRFDALAIPGQAQVPVNWSLSFIGATGGQTNIHEFRNLKVCSTVMQTVTLHHIELQHHASACGADTVSVRACANASCTALYGKPVTVTLTASGNGVSWSSNPVTVTSGQKDVTLSASAGTATIGVASASPVAPNAATCNNGGGGTNCQIVFTSACVDAVEVGKAGGTPIYTKLSATGFDLDILKAGFVGTASVSLIDSTADVCTAAVAALPGTAASVTFVTADLGRKTVSFTYPDAASRAKVRILANGVAECSKDDFAIRPKVLTMSAQEPALTGGTYTAGDAFHLVANAGVSAGYTGQPKLDWNLIAPLPAQATALPIPAALQRFAKSADNNNTDGFPVAGGKSATGEFVYNDVGTITHPADTTKDATFTAVDSGFSGTVTSPAGVTHVGPDCIADSTTNTADATGRYGCVIGSTALGPLGRFRQHHFDSDVRLTPACSTGNFTYMGQPALKIDILLRALSSTGVELLGYTKGNGYAPLAVAAYTEKNAGAQLGASAMTGRLSAALPTDTWSKGVLSFSGNATFARNAAPDGPYDAYQLGLALDAVTSDGAFITLHNTVAANTLAVNSGIPGQAAAPTKLRFGRLKLQNANGSEKLDLPVAMRTEYWDSASKSFLTNVLDDCTTISASNIALGNYLGSVTAATIPASNIVVGPPNTFALGIGKLVLKKPLTAPAQRSSVDLCVDLDGAVSVDARCVAAIPANMPWLQGFWTPAPPAAYSQDPKVRATYGVYKSGPMIYIRETY
jgi:MSHA biogenesis protein MshQ